MNSQFHSHLHFLIIASLLWYIEFITCRSLKFELEFELYKWLGHTRDARIYVTFECVVCCIAVLPRLARAARSDRSRGRCKLQACTFRVRTGRGCATRGSGIGPPTAADTFVARLWHIIGERPSPRVGDCSKAGMRMTCYGRRSRLCSLPRSFSKLLQGSGLILPTSVSLYSVYLNLKETM